MARALYARYRIDAVLRTLEPLHVGGFGDSYDSDMPLWRDGSSRIALPGSSLAGTIRQRLGRASPTMSDDIDAVFGPWLPKSDKFARASAVFVEDAPSLDDVYVELQHHVRIHRFTGAALDRGKFDTETVPRGCRFRFALTVESIDKTHDTVCRRVLADVCRLLADGTLAVGAATTRGQGRVCADADARISAEDWHDPAAVRRWLEQGPAWQPMLDWAKQYPPGVSSGNRLRVTIDWGPEGPLMSKAPEPGLLPDMLPLTSAVGDGEIALMLQGSSIKGVLRSRAERIARTVLGVAATLEATPDCALVDYLFGCARTAVPGDAIDGGANGPSGWRGNIEARTCYSRWRAKADEWWAEVSDAPAGDAAADTGAAEQAQAQALALRELSQALKRGGAHGEVAFHVAIDRWTGGAAESRLFNTIELRDIAWAPIELEIDMRAAPSEVGVDSNADAAWMLLLHVLADLCKGVITLGYGATRGYGACKVRSVAFGGDVSGSSVAASLVRAGTLEHWLRDDAYVEARAALLHAWSAWRMSRSGGGAA